MSNRFAPYDEYQDAGPDWLGKVPNHWELRRLGGFFRERREKVSDKDFPALSVTMQGIVPQLEDAAKTKDGDNRKLVRRGDFVINSRSDRKGSSGVSPLDGSVSLIAIVLEPDGMVPEYVHHLLRSEAFQEEFYRFGKGIVADLWSTNYSAMKNITIPVLSPEEQKQIASFLDYETAKIDALIEKQQQLITLLGEKRQAVISHAVTNGLNSDAPMRDSGVDWLGKVPEHWRVERIGVLYSDSNARAETIAELDLPVLSVSIHHGISDRELTGEELDRKVVRSEDRSLYKTVATNDLAYNMMRAWQGGFGASTIDGLISPAYVVAKPRIELISKYFELVLRTPNAIVELKRFSRGITDFRLRLYWENFKSIKVPVPGRSECKQIIEHVTSIGGQYDELADAALYQIELMKERRTALISAAVTGKIDVRGWKRPSADSQLETEMEVA